MRKRIALFFMAGCMTVLSTFNIAVYPQAAESKEDSAYTTNDEEFTKILDEYGFTLEALLEDYDPEEDPYDWKDHTYEIEKKSLPIYYYEPSKKEEIDLYFMDGEGGIPYISSRDVPEFIGKTVSEDSEDDSEYKIFRCEEGSKTFFIRETMYSVMFDFEEDIIRFQDFDAYIVPSSKATLIDVIGDTGRFTPEGEERLIKIDQEGSYNRFGHSVTVNTRDYGIDLISQDGDYYIPLQVISDFLMAPGLYRSTLFNGGTVYVISGGNYAPLLETLSEGYIDNSGDALNRFSYNELCMVLDSFYGLKEQHGITSFDDFFRETLLKYKFLNTDYYEAFDQALSDLLKIHLDDLHSTVNFASFGSDPGNITLSNGASLNALTEQSLIHSESRSKYYPEGVPFYEEVGDTAYITLDSFSFDTDKDYYTEVPDENVTDTIGRIIYSVSQIKRKDSPIKNVVLDLSQNPGGAVNSAAYTIGAFLGKGNICLKDTLTGAVVRQSFEADTNVDHEFDENDYLKDYNLFCLISPVSFSSGNLVPGALKASNKVTLLGRTSGGGSCTVMFFTTARGNIFQISSPFQLSFSKNGSFYDIDKGIEPDYSITDPDLYYDREYLSDYIHGLLGEE